ncbi:MAG: hypothetical protein ACK4MV_05785 [Beijerinckiaceae bacterium]
MDALIPLPGKRYCMWSSGFPRFNMSFPPLRENLERHLGGLSQKRRLRLVRQNAIAVPTRLVSPRVHRARLALA